MNIWDSVHRGLEKASHEAARIARIQRLRSTIDSVTRQIHTQQELLISRAMEIFDAGQLTQSELLPICQELANLRIQLEQAHSDLKVIQGAGAPVAPTPGAPQIPAGTDAPGSDAPTVYAPPPPEYQFYFDPTEPATAPPPPPGVEPLTVSARETIITNPGTSGGASTQTGPTEYTLYCEQCHAAIAVGNAFCHNCGAPVQDSALSHLPTARAGRLEPIYPTGQETLFDTTTSTPGAEPETRPGTLPPKMADTVAPEQSLEKEKGQ